MATNFFTPTTSKKNTLFDCIIAATAKKYEAEHFLGKNHDHSHSNSGVKEYISDHGKGELGVNPLDLETSTRNAEYKLSNLEKIENKQYKFIKIVFL